MSKYIPLLEQIYNIMKGELFMNGNNKEVGVITEQGFVAGMGLGYTPTNLGNKTTDSKNESNNPNEKQSG